MKPLIPPADVRFSVTAGPAASPESMSGVWISNSETPAGETQVVCDVRVSSDARVRSVGTLSNRTVKGITEGDTLRVTSAMPGPRPDGPGDPGGLGDGRNGPGGPPAGAMPGGAAGGGFPGPGGASRH